MKADPHCHGTQHVTEALANLWSCKSEITRQNQEAVPLEEAWSWGVRYDQRS